MSERLNLPTDLPIDAPDADAAEQARPLVPHEQGEPPSVLVVDEYDAAEQARPLVPDEQGDQPRVFDVDEYDAAEQARVVELDDDEYR
jgi:hypothetical protein